ncbi:MAG: hypothetical protein V5B33_18610 [Candidatus Accumulibacter sp. UW20]
MNYYRISYSINASTERVYPKEMKGVVFTMTQDHASEHFMVAGTEATIDVNGTSIVALTEEAADALVKTLRDTFPKPPPFAGAPFPPPPGR